MMMKKKEKNIVIIHDGTDHFNDIENTLRSVSKNKTILCNLSSSQNKQQSISNVKDFCQKYNHILAMEDK